MYTELAQFYQSFKYIETFLVSNYILIDPTLPNLQVSAHSLGNSV